MRCPNCGATQDEVAQECSSCGVIFAKWRARQERPAAAAPAPAAEPDPAVLGPLVRSFYAREVDPWTHVMVMTICFLLGGCFAVLCLLALWECVTRRSAGVLGPGLVMAALAAPFLYFGNRTRRLSLRDKDDRLDLHERGVAAWKEGKPTVLAWASFKGIFDQHIRHMSALSEKRGRNLRFERADGASIEVSVFVALERMQDVYAHAAQAALPRLLEEARGALAQGKEADFGNLRLGAKELSYRDMGASHGFRKLPWSAVDHLKFRDGALIAVAKGGSETHLAACGEIANLPVLETLVVKDLGQLLDTSGG